MLRFPSCLGHHENFRHPPEEVRGTRDDHRHPDHTDDARRSPLAAGRLLERRYALRGRLRRPGQSLAGAAERAPPHVRARLLDARPLRGRRHPPRARTGRARAAPLRLHPARVGRRPRRRRVRRGRRRARDPRRRASSPSRRSPSRASCSPSWPASGRSRARVSTRPRRRRPPSSATRRASLPRRSLAGRRRRRRARARPPGRCRRPGRRTSRGLLGDTMLAVRRVDPAEVERLLAAIDGIDVDVALRNGRRTVVLCGPAADLVTVQRRFEAEAKAQAAARAQGHRRVAVRAGVRAAGPRAAFHHPDLAEAADLVAAWAQTLRPRRRVGPRRRHPRRHRARSTGSPRWSPRSTRARVDPRPRSRRPRLAPRRLRGDRPWCRPPRPRDP